MEVPLKVQQAQRVIATYELPRMFDMGILRLHLV